MILSTEIAEKYKILLQIKAIKLEPKKPLNGLQDGILQFIVTIE